MMNRPVTVQFWLDVGSSGWYERLDQPLTHPQVLSREMARWQTMDVRRRRTDQPANNGAFGFGIVASLP